MDLSGPTEPFDFDPGPSQMRDMSLEPIAGRLEPREAASITRRTAGLSVAAAGLLIVAKCWAFAASSSISMLASLADSGLDLAASMFTLWAVSRAAAPPDDKHRFGFGKAEGFAALVQAALVGASSALVAREAVDRFSRPQQIEGEAIALAVMGLSIALTAIVLFFQNRAIARTGSVATAGDRAHYAADFASNIAVVVSIAASWLFHWTWVDPVIGLLVALWLAWGALGVARTAASQLMDRELPESARGRIRDLAQGDAPISVHNLRTRASGPIVHIQFHMEVAPNLSLIAVHELMVACEKRILAEFPGADILIHPDPRGFAEPHGGSFFGERGAVADPREADADANAQVTG